MSLALYAEKNAKTNYTIWALGQSSSSLTTISGHDDETVVLFTALSAISITIVTWDQGRAYYQNWGRNVTRNVIVEKRIFLLSNVFQKKRCVSIAYHLRITTYKLYMSFYLYIK